MQETAPKQEAPVVKPARPPQLPGVIFDSDMGANIDAVLALALLYGSGAKVKLVSVTVANANLQAAAFCDAMGRFYAGSKTLVKSQYYAPVGLAENGRPLPDVPMLTKPLALRTVDGQPMFINDVRNINDTADVAIAMRNALVAQKDGEAVIVAAGPASNLMRVLAMPGNKQIVAAKTKVLIMAAGAYPDGPADPRIAADVAAARHLFAEWPTPIVAVGCEVGNQLPYPAASIETDFAWSPEHPVVEAYRAYKAMPYDAPSQALAAALYAVDAATASKELMFQLSDPGVIEVLAGGRTRFTQSASGNHRYLIANAARKEEIIKAYTTLASAKPIIPPARGPRVQANQVPAKAEQPVP
jgi:inosine-uridine nucleoside N-ribohydrolase